MLFYFLFAKPIWEIAFAPSFSVETTLDKPTITNYRVYKKVSTNLIDDPDISQESNYILKHS